MRSFTHKKNTIDFWQVTGEVLSHDKHSETHVSSYGGGGYVGPQGGHISPAIVSSTVTNKQDIWIKADDGQELSLHLTGVDVPLRAGQKITVLLAKRKEQDDSAACVVYSSFIEP